MPEKRFHLFVRKHHAGVAVQVIGHSHLCAFAADVLSARADLAHVLTKLLERGDLWRAPTFFEDAKLRKVDLTIRALQRGRLLEVPMRFSVVTGGERPERSGTAARRKVRARSVRVYVPRLELHGELNDSADLNPFVEELIRHHLYMAPLERLLALSYSGDERLDLLAISAQPPERGESSSARRGHDSAASRDDLELPDGLAEACRRLDADAALGTLDRGFQRDTELARLQEVVSARARASALLVGAAGVGKSTLVHELAYRAREQGTPVSGMEIYSTSAGRIVAGMRYLGEWQARVERMIGELRVRRAILHLDNLGELCALGDDDRTDVVRHLLPSVESGEISLILEATPEEVARAERTHAAFVQALRQLPLHPLSPVHARAALGQVAARVGRERRVKIEDRALDRALDLVERFGEGALPGRAVELVRAAATTHAGTRKPGSEEAIDAAHITATFSTQTGYPRALIDPTMRMDPEEVRAAFAARVVGQPQATELLAQLVITLKTNLSDPKRPLGSFLLLGPTGVGKTESALALASYLFGDDKRLVRFDMAEYAAPGSAARLTASHGAEATLARRVREQPFGVVLLDEIEKADRGVHDLLLQLLDEGRFTDAGGRSVSFRNTVVILTSNLGAEGAGRSMGFDGGASAKSHDAHYRAAAAAFFRPELLNRFDHVVPFHPLPVAAIQSLALRMLERALGREGVSRRGVKVTWDEAVIGRLAELGFDPRLGARPLKRAVETHVTAPLARLLAARSERPPARVRLYVDGAARIELAAEDGGR
ncbi:MAG: AAA family ATPase [Kofleriaceae bacterium]